MCFFIYCLHYFLASVLLFSFLLYQPSTVYFCLHKSKPHFWCFKWHNNKQNSAYLSKRNQKINAGKKKYLKIKPKKISTVIYLLTTQYVCVLVISYYHWNAYDQKKIEFWCFMWNEYFYSSQTVKFRIYCLGKQ